jgi:hypothetical protein
MNNLVIVKIIVNNLSSNEALSQGKDSKYCLFYGNYEGMPREQGACVPSKSNLDTGFRRYGSG